MDVHLDPIVLTARFYTAGTSYENKDAYAGVCTVQLEGSTAYVSAAHGRVARGKTELFKKLRSMGQRLGERG
jgi:hypothetical protein